MDLFHFTEIMRYSQLALLLTCLIKSFSVELYSCNTVKCGWLLLFVYISKKKMQELPNGFDYVVQPNVSNFMLACPSVEAWGK